jgi:hypothetical protein
MRIRDNFYNVMSAVQSVWIFTIYLHTAYRLSVAICTVIQVIEELNLQTAAKHTPVSLTLEIYSVTIQ